MSENRTDKPIRRCRGVALSQKIKMGVSACLLGERVRYDGGHRHDRYITGTLGQYMHFVPVCPEVEAGLGVPREPLRLVGDPENPRLVARSSGRDITELMRQWAAQRVRELEKEGLCGFIFKSQSPSSGMERVKVYGEGGMPVRRGTGLFARALMAHFPLLPVEEDGRLHDPRLRENFIERVFVFQRWRELLDSGPSLRGLEAFHSRHKLLIMSHSPAHARQLGKLVAGASRSDLGETCGKYASLLADALKLRATPRKNANVLMHILGYFKRQLTADEKQEFLEQIEHYRTGYTPLIVPVTLANHYVRKYRQPYLGEQVYLNPHPIELCLRNHA